MKVFIKILVIVIVIVFIGGGIYNQVAKKNKKEAAVTVRVEKVTKGELLETVNAPGVIKPWRNVEISARISARLAELPFEAGDLVKGPHDDNPGDLLVRLDSTDMQASLQSTEARRAAQEAQIEVARVEIESRKISVQGIELSLKQARKQLERRQLLLQTGDITEIEVEELQTRVDELGTQLASAMNAVKSSEMNLKVMEENLKAANAEIERARDMLSYATIRSPIDGIVTRLNAEVGEIAMTGTMNNPGTVILEVADLSKMLLSVQIDEVDVDKVKEGQKVTVKIQALPDEDFKSTIYKRSLVLLQDRMGTRYCEVEVLLDNPEHRILSGMTADVEIQVKQHDDILKIPSQCVQGREWDSLPIDVRDNPLIDKEKSIVPIVFTFENGEAIAKPVIIGASDMNDTVIEDGLEETDQVITGPYKELEGLTHKKKVEEEKPEGEKAGKKEGQSIKDSESEKSEMTSKDQGTKKE